jgi:hypothetical protein
MIFSVRCPEGHWNSLITETTLYKRVGKFIISVEAMRSIRL